MVLLSVYNNVNVALKDNDHKVISRSSGRGIPDVVASLYFTGKDISVNVSDSFYGLLAEEYGGFYGLFVHLFIFWVHKDTGFGVLNQIYRILDQNTLFDSMKFVLILRLEN